MTEKALNKIELRAGIGLGLVLAFRMLGLFLIIPVFSLLARDIDGQTPLLIGLAIGVYGLTQALLQQPFGHLSDRLGRRPVLLFGLSLFVLGGIVAAFSTSINGIILGRAIQGCGAVASVALALAGDISRPASRSIVMAIIGIGIGTAFMLSILISVPLAALLGLKGLFMLTAALGLVAIILVFWIVPANPVPVELTAEETQAPEAEGVAQASETASKMPLWVLNIGIFILHASMTVLFINFPRLLEQEHQWDLVEHWKLYAPTMLISAIIVFPLLRRIGRDSLTIPSLAWILLLQSVGLIALIVSGSMPLVFIALAMYFLSFNLQEALFPAQVSILAETARRGKVMGQYTTFQFMGSFAGGVLGGMLLGQIGFSGALWFMAAVTLLWFAVLLSVSRVSNS